MTRWEKPQMVRTEFTAQLSCACSCGVLAGSGSGNDAQVPVGPGE